MKTVIVTFYAMWSEKNNFIKIIKGDKIDKRLSRQSKVLIKSFEKSHYNFYNCFWIALAHQKNQSNLSYHTDQVNGNPCELNIIIIIFSLTDWNDQRD